MIYYVSFNYFLNLCVDFFVKFVGHTQRQNFNPTKYYVISVTPYDQTKMKQYVRNFMTIILS